MRTDAELKDFRAQARSAYLDGCDRCRGVDVTCKCFKRYAVVQRLYESCVPRDFWDYTNRDVHRNKHVYRHIVKPYRTRLTTALRSGYGLFLTGDNGSGKTMFLCLVCKSAIKQGFTVYYTTLSSLFELYRRSKYDNAVRARLDWYLTSDFLVVDEFGKGSAKDMTDVSWLEDLLKRRYEARCPTLIASNASLTQLEKDYGTTIASLFTGKFLQATLDPGDYRTRQRRTMYQDMGVG